VHYKKNVVGGNQMIFTLEDIVIKINAQSITSIIQEKVNTKNWLYGIFLTDGNHYEILTETENIMAEYNECLEIKFVDIDWKLKKIFRVMEK
jgi:hypothetical protein